jgi:hypothetical protein
MISAAAVIGSTICFDVGITSLITGVTRKEFSS